MCVGEPVVCFGVTTSVAFLSMLEGYPQHVLRSPQHVLDAPATCFGAPAACFRGTTSVLGEHSKRF